MTLATAILDRPCARRPCGARVGTKGWAPLGAKQKDKERKEGRKMLLLKTYKYHRAKGQVCARSCHRLTRHRRRLREVPISRNKTSGHTTWLDVERPQLPAGWLRSPALVDLGGYHGRCLWPQRSVRSARALPVFRSPHA